MTCNTGASDIGDAVDSFPGSEAAGNFGDGGLAHAVDQQIRLGIEEYRPADLIGPIIVMGEAAKARFYAADNHWNPFADASDPLYIFQGGPVGSESGLVCR
jgi:hypothetical protein